MRKSTPFLAGIVLVSVMLQGCGGAGPTSYLRAGTDAHSVRKVAVFPLENYTSDDFAGEKVRRVVATEFLARGIDVVEPGEVTRVLREQKVKGPASLRAEDIQGMGKTLGVDAVVTGGVGAYGISKGISTSYPEVSIQLLMHDVASGKVMWSVLHTAGGADFWMRHFGTEGKPLSDVARKAVAEGVDTLFEKR